MSSTGPEVDSGLSLAPGQGEDEVTSPQSGPVIQSEDQHLGLLRSSSPAELQQDLQWRTGPECSQIIPADVFWSSVCYRGRGEGR